MMAKATRHSHLAKDLGAIRAYLTRPETSGIGTNWRTTPDNDNQPHLRDSEGALVEDGVDHGWEVEKRLEFQPSIGFIKREMLAALESDDVEKNDFGQIIRIGKLQFAGGLEHPFDTPSERAYKRGPEGTIVLGELRVPVGGLLFQRERSDRMRGTDNRRRCDEPKDEVLRERHVRLGNEYIAETLKAHLPRNIRGGKRKPGTRYTHGGAKEVLAAAYEETARLIIYEGKKPPKAAKYPAGLPWQPKELWSVFPSLVRREGEDTAAQSWQDLEADIVSQEAWAEALAALPAKDKAVLNVLPRAKNMTEIGVAAGQSPSYARNGGGIAALQAANDNLEPALAKAL